MNIHHQIGRIWSKLVLGSLTRPIKELKGFEKISLKPGDVKTVSFELKAEDLQFFNGDDYVIEPGDFDIWIGPNSAEGLHDSFAIK